MEQTAKEPMPPVKFSKFRLGRLYFTRAAMAQVAQEDMMAAVNRHSKGDWGDLCDEDNDANEQALRYGGRILSAYKDGKGIKFWIITEADRTSTTVLLPDDY
jgi:hypothetical protein